MTVASNEGTSSVRAELRGAIAEMPAFARATQVQRAIVVARLANSIEKATTDAPLSVEAARRQLNALAAATRPSGSSRRFPQRVRAAKKRGAINAKLMARAVRAARVMAELNTVDDAETVTRDGRAARISGFRVIQRRGYQVVDIEKLAELYPKGGDVTVADLVAKGVVRQSARVRVVEHGDISVKLNVVVDKVSSNAEKKILGAGGTIK